MEKKDRVLEYKYSEENINKDLTIQHGIYISTGNTYLKPMCENPAINLEDWSNDQKLEARMVLDVLELYNKSTVKQRNSKGFKDFIKPYRFTLQQALILGQLEEYFTEANKEVNSNKGGQTKLAEILSNSFVRLNKFIPVSPGPFRKPYGQFSDIVIEDPELFLYLIKGGIDYLDPTENESALMFMLKERIEIVLRCLEIVNLMQAQLQLSNVQFTNWCWVNNGLREKCKDWLAHDGLKFMEVDWTFLNSNSQILDTSKEPLIKTLFGGIDGLTKMLSPKDME